MIERFRPDRLANRDTSWFAADALLALTLGYLSIESMRAAGYVELYGAVTGLTWVFALGPTALILVRRAAPATALAAATVMYLVAAVDLGESNAILAAPFLAYTVTLTRPPRISTIIVAAAAIPVSLTAFYGPGPIEPAALPVMLVFFAFGWVVGLQVRRNHLRQEQLAAEARDAARRSAEVAQQAVADERERIARELHDAVGHAVNVMVMQAGAARLVATEPRAVTALGQIERVGRSALSDLDRMLGLLHGDGDEPAPLEPAHRLADIAGLVAGVRSGGADVHLHDECGEAIDASVERPIGAAAYRIVQESLTNAVKHAGPARIDVTISCDDDELVVTVADDGRGAAAQVPANGGRGLVGMHERVNVLGGELTAAPAIGGGFRVEARLPRQRVDR